MTDLGRKRELRELRGRDDNPWASNTAPPPEWARGGLSAGGYSRDRDPLPDTNEGKVNTLYEDELAIKNEVVVALNRAYKYDGVLTKRQLAVKVAQHLIEKIGDWS